MQINYKYVCLIHLHKYLRKTWFATSRESVDREFQSLQFIFLLTLNNNIYKFDFVLIICLLKKVIVNQLVGVMMNLFGVTIG